MRWDELRTGPKAPRLAVTGCLSCGEPGPGVKSTYQCGECWHEWVTDGDLQLHDHRARGGTGRVRNVDEIHSCPCCAHDF